MRYLLIIFFFHFAPVHAQEDLDSLWNVYLNTENNDSIRNVAIETVIRKGFLFTKPDSAFTLAQLQFDLGLMSDNKAIMANAANSLAISCAVRGKSQEALTHFNTSLELKTLIGDQAGVADCLNNIGINYRNMDMLDSALYYTNKSMEIKKRIGHRKGVANSLHSLGSILRYLGRYEEARISLLKSIEIKDSLGDKKGMANSLNNLGLVYQDINDFGKASKYFHESLEIKEDIGDLRGTSGAYISVGLINKDLGHYEKALDYLKKSLEIKKEIGDKRGEGIALSNIGLIYMELDDFETPIKYFNEGLKVQKSISRKRGIMSAYLNLGWLYEKRREFKKSAEFYHRSLDVAKSMEEQIEVAKVQIYMGIQYLRAGNKDSSLFYLESGLKLAEENGSIQDIGIGVRGLFQTLNCHGLSKRASEMSDRISIFFLGKLFTNYPVLSEHQKELLFQRSKPDLDLIYDFAQRHPEFTDQSEEACNHALIVKGLLLKSSNAMRIAIMNSGDSTIIANYNHWRELRQNIANTYSRGEDVSEMESEAEELEKLLAVSSNEFSNFEKLKDLKWQNVQQALDDGEVAIEFVRYHKPTYCDTISTKKVLYSAILIGQKFESPKMIKIFEEAELERIIGTFPGNNLSYIDQIYGSKENTKTQLYDLIWEPMEKELKGAKKVYVSPVGLLHKISFAALAKEQDVYLCDLYDVEMKSSTGKLAVPSTVAYNENSTTSLFGGIDYNSDSTSSEIWSYLDGSLSETEAIEKVLQKEKRTYNYFNEKNATEAQFKEIASNSNILHIATHGFFYADPDLALAEMVDEEESNADIVFRGGRTGMGMNTFVKSRNPLMRSGLAFAGANDVWNRTLIDGEDGVLTAAEVATIDMRNTDLVVLSACETGLGDIRGSEGVYGLQRSFKMAGVKYLIMSLWQVPDKETAEFMTSFYKNLTKTNDIKESFNATQMEMRKKYDPYYWAAFVLVE